MAKHSTLNWTPNPEAAQKARVRAVQVHNAALARGLFFSKECAALSIALKDLRAYNPDSISELNKLADELEKRLL
jgi:hypothetical protein